MYSYIEARHPKNLHAEFVRLGRERNRITYQLLTLLPEISAQKIYIQKGYTTIYEYAAKIAGLSPGVVSKTLRIAKHLEDKPHLQAAVTTQGIHKVALVACIATPQNEEALADKVCNMSQSSVQELAKELKAQKVFDIVQNNKIGKEPGKAPCKAAQQKISIELDEEMQFLFLQLKKKIGHQMSNKEVLRKILAAQTGITISNKTYDKNFAGEKIVKKEKNAVIPCGRLLTSVARRDGRQAWHEPCLPVIDSEVAQTRGASLPALACKPRKTTRYIPVEQRRTALAEHNNRCAYPNCNKPHDCFHHTVRFSEDKSHTSIIPLCNTHHQFMHNGLVASELDSPWHWRLQLTEGVVTRADGMYREARALRSGRHGRMRARVRLPTGTVASP